MRSIRWLFLILLGVAASFTYAAPQGTSESALPPCPSSAKLCYFQPEWTLEELLAAVGTLEPGHGKIIKRGDAELTFVYHLARHYSVTAVYGTGQPEDIEMERMPGTPWWMVGVQIQQQKGEEIILTFGVREHGERTRFITYPVASWHGYAPFPDMAQVEAQPGDFPRCPSESPLCQFPTTWTVAELEAQLGDVPRGNPALLAPEDRLTFVYRAEEGIDNVTAVHYAGQLEEIQMDQVEGSEWWVLDMKVQIPPGSEYSITLGLGRYSAAGKDIRYPVIRWSRTCANDGFACETAVDHPPASEVPWCPSPSLLCRVGQSWTVEQLRAEVGELRAGAGKFFGDEWALTFVYRTSTPEFDRASVMLRSGTMDEIPMQRVQASDWWTVTLRIQDDRGDEAIISADIAEHRAEMSQFRSGIAFWRGKNAPPPAPRNTPLRGLQFVVPFKSRALNQTRDVYVYLPPNYDPHESYPVIYMSDGQALPDYAGTVDYLITSGDIPPLVMIGTASATSDDGTNPRGDEYVPGRKPEVFERHERFFTQEVRMWAQHMYGASTERAENILFGISNGGLFVAEMSVRHPDLYGTIFPFSAGASAGDGSVAITKERLRLPLNVYATAGLLEPIFHNTTDHLLRAYAWAGANSYFSERIGGHDGAMWEIEFVSAMTWLYARK